MVGSRLRRPSRRTLRMMLLAGVLVLLGFLYQAPLRAYLETRERVAERSAQVRALRIERRSLERRLAFQTRDEALVAEARRLGYVKPGERLFIVKGIPGWRRARARPR